MFFDSKSSFEYNDDGTMDFPKKYEDSIKFLRLESNINLKLIRKTWSELMWLYDIEDVKRAINDGSLRKEMLADTILMPHEAKRMANERYWKLLYDYRWFGEHFLILHSKKKKSEYRS